MQANQIDLNKENDTGLSSKVFTPKDLQKLYELKDLELSVIVVVLTLQCLAKLNGRFAPKTCH